MFPASLTLLALLLSPAPQQKLGPHAAVKMHVQALPDDAMLLNTTLAPKLPPSGRSKVESTATALVSSVHQKPAMTTAQVEATARAAVIQVFPSAAPADVNTLVFLVVMQAALDEQHDLQQTVNSVNSSSPAMANADAPSSSKPSTITPAQLKSIQQNLQSQLDAMNEMSEMTSMRLQMGMDRRSKFVEALSNVMKKIDSTQETIVQNMK
jgi:hypothetical protein